MDLSKSEVLTLCQRFFSGSNLPPGIDTEAANTVVWLELHGFSELEELAATTPKLNQFQIAVTSLDCNSESEPIDAENFYFDAWIELADWLAAISTTQESHESSLKINNVGRPQIILPLLLQRSIRGYEFDADLSCCRVIVSNGKLWASKPIHNYLEKSVRSAVEIRCRHIGSAKQDQPVQVFGITTSDYIEDAQLFADAKTRIEVTEETYWKLKKTAANCFVPASELSRQRGAGAEVDDSL